MSSKNKSVKSVLGNRKVLKLSGIVLAFVFVLAPFLAQAATLDRQLEIGMSGEDVSALQKFLATDITIYPQGLVTGYYGFLTKAAVSNFQSANGISAVGRVGAVTLPVLNLQMTNGMTNNTSGNLKESEVVAVIMNVNTSVSRNSSTVSWKTNEYAKGVLYYSSSPLTTYEYPNSVAISGQAVMTDADSHTSQSIALTNLDSDTKYYYMIYATDQNGNVSVTWPSTFRTDN